MADEAPRSFGGRFGVLLGVLQLAVGQGRGMRFFANTPQAYLTSLIPLLAFPLAVGIYLGGTGHLLAGLALVLVVLVGQLAPAVLSFELSRLWKRDAYWCRYATAWNWCQWVIPLATVILATPLVAMQGPQAADAPLNPAAMEPQMLVVVGIFVLYALLLNGIVARHGFGFGWVRAFALVIIVNLGSAALVIVPSLVQAVLDGGGGANGSGS